jgi:hypothetical protein
MDYKRKYLKYKNKYCNKKKRINNIINFINKNFMVSLYEHQENYLINGNKIGIKINNEIDEKVNDLNKIILKKENIIYSFSFFHSLMNIYKIRNLLIPNNNNIIPYLSSKISNYNVDYEKRGKYDGIFLMNKVSNIDISILKTSGYIFSFNKLYEKDLIKEGIIISDYDLEKPSLNVNKYIYIYRKIGLITSSIYDKPLILSRIEYNNNEFNVIREDKLIGGTKQRIIIPFLKGIKEQQIFYRSPSHGYAQVALAYGCLLLNKKCHIIVNMQDDGKNLMTLLAMVFGAIIHETPKIYGKKREGIYEKMTQKISQKYKDTKILPLGIKNKETLDYYIKSEIRNLVKLDIKIIWLVSSTGLIYHSLHRLLPNSHFNVVFVGYKNYEIIKDRTTVYEAPERYNELAVNPPPYPSPISYDAKLWQFVIKFGKKGDYIFNVAGLNIYQ